MNLKELARLLVLKLIVVMLVVSFVLLQVSLQFADGILLTQKFFGQVFICLALEYR